MGKQGEEINSVHPLSAIILHETFKTVHDGSNDVGPDHCGWETCNCNGAERIRDMGDSLHLSGPDANMERDDFLAEQNRAQNMDGSKILALLKSTFITGPKKTIDKMTLEEVLKHKYTLEETVRNTRVHLLEVDRAERKLKAKVSDKVFKDLDKNYKPKPVPASRQATNDFEDLVQKLMVKKDLTREEAIEFLK